MGGFVSAISAYSSLFVILLTLVCIILLFVTINLSMTVKRLEKKYRSFMRGADGVSLEKELLKRLGSVEKFEKRLDNYKEDLGRYDRLMSKTAHKYGIVKYDAFDDVGGKLSFVLAFLDDEDSGFVLNAVHSKENCFLYIKEILKGESYIMLSNEEIQALRIAKRYGTDDELVS